MHLPVALHRHPGACGALRHGELQQHRHLAHTHLRNATRSTLLATDCRTASSFVSRGIGLLGRSGLREGEALLIPKTSSITMVAMRFAIDAVFIDRRRRVVRVAPHLRPWTLAVGARGASDVIELPAGTAARTGTQVGDELVFDRR